MQSGSAPANRLRRALMWIYFFSGASSLVYQVVWQRALSTHFGVGPVSTTVIVSLFMAGLGIGSYVGGALTRRARDPVAAYFAYSGTVVGMAVAAFAVLTVLQARHDEVTGLTGHALATGVRRWEPLVWNVAAAGAGSAVILVATGALSAVIAPPVIGGTHAAVRAFAYSAGQWPAAMACAGWTTLLIGVRPRWAWLAWAPVVAGGGLALLGRLLGVPRGVQRLGVFQHVPDLGAASPDLRALGLLLLVSGAACLLGVAGMARRDLAGG